VVAPWIWRRVEGIIAVSQDVAKDLRELNVDSDRIAVISSGVELSQFVPITEDSRWLARQRLGISPMDFVIVGVGNLNPVKGFTYLIEALKHLGNLKNLQLFIVGDGALRSELESLAAQVSAVHLLGSTPHDQVQMYLHAADLSVLPSVDLPGKAEGTPTAVMEAMAVGLPIITTDSGGAKSVIEAVQGLTVVQQRDSKALADSILQFAKDSDLRKHVGEANRGRVMCRDWPRIAFDVCQFYERIMALPRR
jgi:glycosyltransferase involved in cell wall biosynthesis